MNLPRNDGPDKLAVPGEELVRWTGIVCFTSAVLFAMLVINTRVSIGKNWDSDNLQIDAFGIPLIRAEIPSGTGRLCLAIWGWSAMPLLGLSVLSCFAFGAAKFHQRHVLRRMAADRMTDERAFPASHLSADGS